MPDLFKSGDGEESPLEGDAMSYSIQLDEREGASGLKPCPICGSKTIVIEQQRVLFGSERYRRIVIRCVDCTARITAPNNRIAWGRKLWNKRV